MFTLSRRREGLPVAVMEPLRWHAGGRDTRPGGIPEAVGDAGRIVKIGDPMALAAAYVDLAQDSELRARLAAKARNRAQRFSIERAVAEITAVYDEATSVSAR